MSRTVYLDHIGVEKEGHHITSASVIRCEITELGAKVLWDQALRLPVAGGHPNSPKSGSGFTQWT